MKGRIAMELHDLVSPFYTEMLHQIEKAQIRDQGIESDLKIKLSAMTNSVREISHRMDNTFIGQLSISELVKGLCKDLRLVSSIPINCAIYPEGINLDSERTIHVYRIIQELLTNAIKYVNSGEINISISQESGLFGIIYQDSGPGFQQQLLERNSLGLSIIFERSKILNGKAILNTTPGSGTKWNIVIPLS